MHIIYIYSIYVYIFILSAPIIVHLVLAPPPEACITVDHGSAGRVITKAAVNAKYIQAACPVVLQQMKQRT